MNRFALVLSVALLPSVAWAERIEILNVDASLNTRTDMMNVSVELSGPMNLDFDYLRIWLFQHFPGESRQYALVIDDARSYDPATGTIGVEYRLRQGATTVFRETVRMPIEFTDLTHLTWEMPRDPTRYEVATFDARVLFEQQGYSEVVGFDVDARVIHAPEPSSVALASVGVIALGWHLVRRPSMRERIGKRRAG